MKRHALAAAFGCAAVALGLAACSGGDRKVERPASELGQQLFHERTFSSSNYNRFSCATCHAESQTEPADRTRAGSTLFDAANRPGWYRGYSTQLLDAVNFCLVYYMRGEAIVPGDPDGDALYAYLASISPDPSPPPLNYTFVRNITALPAGDPVAGEGVYERTCRICHGDKDSGAGRISSSTTILNAALSAEYDTLFPGTDHSLVVIEKVRHGQFYGIGGNMPFFSEERLSDAELSDVIAWLSL